MKTILDYLKAHWPVLTLFIAWLPITFFNTKIYWMLVDDGYDVIFSRTLFEKLSSLNIAGFFSQLLEGGGRFRPVYWLYHTTVWVIGGNSYQFQHFAHMVVIGTTVLFIYLIIRELTRSKLISFFGALFYLLIPLNAENIMRLGPQEPLLAMFLSITFYLLIKNRRLIFPCIMIFLAIFSKETSVAIIPVLIFYYLFTKRGNLVKNGKQTLYLLITAVVSSVVLLLITTLTRTGYSTNYYFNLPMIFANLSVFLKELSINTLYLFPVIPAIYVLRMIFALLRRQKIFKTKSDLFEFLFLAGFFCFLAIQLPWKYALTRYLMPSILFLTLSMFMEINRILGLLSEIKLPRPYKEVSKYLLVFAGIYISLIWGIMLVFKEAAYSPLLSQSVFAKMASYPKNTTILMNMSEGEATIELVYETQVILSEFWGRGDIKSAYLNLDSLPEKPYVIIDSDQFPRKYPKEELRKIFGKEYFYTEKTSKRLVLTTPLEFIKQSAKKSISYALTRRGFNSEGLYTYYYNYSNWYFFNE